MSGVVLEIASKPRGVVRRRQLSEEEWEALASAVLEVITKHLTKHLATDAEKETLDVLDEVVEIDDDALASGRVAFIFQEHWQLGALCGYHWYVHALHACWDEISALFRDRGQKVVERKPDLAEELGPRAGYAFATVPGGMIAVHPNGEAIASTGSDGDAVVAYDAEVLDATTREVAKQLYDTGLCRCSLCSRARPARVQGKPAAKRLPRQPARLAWQAALEASRRGELARLDALIASGEYVDVGRCFEEGVRSPDAVTVKHLIERGHAPTAEAVANAARYNAVRALEVMRDAGVDLEGPDSLGRGPLANAALYGSTEALRFLLDAGAAVDAVDQHHGCTALLWAIGAENEDPERTIPMLLEAGASTEARDHRGRGLDELLALIADETRRARFSRALGRS